MTKKAVKSKPKVQKKSHVMRWTIFIFSALVLALGVTIFYNVTNTDYCANSITCIDDLTGQKDDNNTGVYMGKAVSAPKISEYALVETRAVLGDTTNPGNKRLYVDLTKQRLYAFEGNTLVYDFPVSTGKWWPTPTGEFRIWTWLRYTRMSGGSKANGTYYNLPNVPFTMYFANAAVPKYRGYGIHGAYWHNNFGTPMSHGCVNMKTEDVEKVYNWTYQNTSIPLTIFGKTPKVT